MSTSYKFRNGETWGVCVCAAQDNELGHDNPAVMLVNSHILAEFVKYLPFLRGGHKAFILLFDFTSGPADTRSRQEDQTKI